MRHLPISRDAVVQTIWETVQALPENERLAMKRYYVDNWPAKECAEAGGLSLTEFVSLKRTVRQRFLDSVAKPEAQLATAGGVQ
jgi:DNA-directed RNA polymerase specialized sigma24 family protein